MLCDFRWLGFFPILNSEVCRMFRSEFSLWASFARLVMGNVIDGEEAVAIFAIAKDCIYQIISFVSFRTARSVFRTVGKKGLDIWWESVKFVQER